MRFPIMVSTILILLLATAAMATDLQYGYDALPSMSLDATLIVSVSELAEITTSSTVAQLYRFRLNGRIRGEFGDDILLALYPRNAASPPINAAPSSLVFLAGPIPPEDLQRWQVTANEPVYILVGGPNSVIPITAPPRREGILKYLQLGSPKPSVAAFEWSEEYLASDDPFLQYSAIHQLDRFNNISSLALLAGAIKSQKLTDANRKAAIRVITSAGTEQAMNLLIEIAKTDRLSDSIQQSAVSALGKYLPDAMKQLTDWKKLKDKVLSPAAKQTLTRYELNQQQ